MGKDYDRVGIVGHQTARLVLDPRKSARPNNTLPKVGTGKHMNRVMIDQLTIEELRDQFENETFQKNKPKMRNSYMYFNDNLQMRWLGYLICAKANNILREG